MKKKIILNGQPIEINGGVSYSAGDGTTIEDGEISITTPIRGIYTQEEYDALPESEKITGLLIIDDGEDNGGSTGGSTGGVTLDQVNSAISNAIGDIDSILDAINGEVV